MRSKPSDKRIVRPGARAALAVLAMLGSAFLGALPAGAQGADPPALVGRIALLSGQVSFHAAGAGTSAADWTAAALNYPLVAGDSIWTQPGAHAAIEVGPISYRLDGATELDVETIDDQTTRLRIDQGSVDIRLVALVPGTQSLVDTPRGTVTLDAPGLYRVDAGTAAGPTRLVAFEGKAAFAAPGTTYGLAAGQSIAITGAGPYSFAPGPATATALDQWAAAEDAAADAAVTPYVSPDETGYQELTRYGTWETIPDYGPVWYPASVPAGWAPYRFGHWVWIEPWGWTWIDDEPWGFAPFHYGRWLFYRERWIWVPGAVEPHPVYAPALVAWIGGDGWSLSLSSGRVAAVGWVPLGPHEAYRPPYRASAGYEARLNGNRRAVEHTSYVNRGAATIVSHETFAGSRPVARATLHPSSAELASAPFRTEPGAGLPRPTAHPAAAPRPRAASLPRMAHEVAPARGPETPARAAALEHAAPAARVEPRPVERPVERPAPHPVARPAPRPAPAFNALTPPPLALHEYERHPAMEPGPGMFHAAPAHAAPRAMPHPAPHPMPHPAARPEAHPAPQGPAHDEHGPPGPEHH